MPTSLWSFAILLHIRSPCYHLTCLVCSKLMGSTYPPRLVKKKGFLSFSIRFHAYLFPSYAMEHSLATVVSSLKLILVRLSRQRIWQDNSLSTVVILPCATRAPSVGAM
eukprot:Rmarinus@m.17415